MADAEAPGSRDRGHRVRNVLIGLTVVGLAIGGSAAWQLWPRDRHFYSDADTIRVPAGVAMVRDILWRPPVTLPDGLNTVADDYEPRLSADGLTLFFVRGKAGENADIYSCRKTLEGWTEPEALSAVNSEYDELGPEPSPDGRSLYFYSDRPGGLGGYDLWVVHRGLDGSSDFGQPANLGPMVNSEFSDYGPALAPDGETLCFASNRPQEGDPVGPSPNAWPATLREDLYVRDYDLYTARLTDRGVEQAQPLADLNTPYNDGAPAVSPVGDYLYFASDRPGGAGGFDLFRSRRLRGGYQPAANLGTTVNTPANELDPALGMGGFGLYFSSDRRLDQQTGEEPAEYNLYYTESREVFTDVETEQARINWAALWRTLWPNLLLALLALLAALLLLWMLGGMRGRRLSLLTRCLLASLLAHLVLLMLFSLWEVSVGLADTLRGGRKLLISLAAPAQGDGLTSQIRGGLTEIDTPSPAELTARRHVEPLTIDAQSALAKVPIDERPIRFPDRPVATPVAVDARPSPASEVPARSVMLVSADSSTTLELALPTLRTPNRTAEALQEAKAAPAAHASLSRPALEVSADLSLEHEPEVELSPGTIHPVELAVTSVRLADAMAPREASVDIPTAVEVTDAMASFEDLRPTELTLPAVPQERLQEAVESHPAVAGVAPAPARGRFVQRLAEDSAADVHYDVAPARTGLRFGEIKPGPPPDAVADAPLPTAMAPGQPVFNGAEIVGPGLADLVVAVPDESAAVAMEETAARTPDPVRPPPRARRTDPTPSDPDDLGELGELVALAPLGGLNIATPGQPIAELLSSETPLDTARLLLPGLPEPISDATTPETSLLELNLPTELPIPDTPFAQRSPSVRLAYVRRQGGSEQTEAAVALALKWLARHQDADGHWDGDAFDDQCGGCDGQTKYMVDVGLTGLSLLCFLGADHTPNRDGPYQDTVARGLRWLLDKQSSDGDLRGPETMYSHGIATIALAEAHAMTGDSRLREPVQTAVRFIEGARNEPNGGWRYDPGQPGDTSVLGWQVMALKSARLAGVDVSWEAFDGARRWLELVGSPSHPGLYAYRPGWDYTPTMTAEGMFVQHVLGRSPDDPRMQASAALLMDNLPDWESHPNTYYWYYATLALFQHQGQPWQRWNRLLTAELLEHQRSDGPVAGSWDPVGDWTHIGGRIYQTALCTLMLEVYYRYLPMYSPQTPADAIGTVRGRVVDAATSEGLAGAMVRLDLPDRPAVTVETGPNGQYELFPPEVPDFFALSASAEGYIPRAVNVATSMVMGTTLHLDFQLDPASETVVVIEAVPQVHHLGDDRFDGRINSQFQKEAEGSVFTAQFRMHPDQLPPHFTSAEVSMLAKGVQTDHRLVINKTVLGARLDQAPRDGSFGEFTAAFDASLLEAGINTFQIRASSIGDDVDDFEFVNVTIRLTR